MVYLAYTKRYPKFSFALTLQNQPQTVDSQPRETMQLEH